MSQPTDLSGRHILVTGGCSGIGLAIVTAFKIAGARVAVFDRTIPDDFAITHPDVIRYFMTIPEASQLVLQAGAMAEGGDVFVLDMGKPVRIADLARRMVHLSGLTVRDEDDTEGDIEIRYTGLRPAEKLFEELLIGSNVSGTEHPSILRAVEHSWAWHDMQSSLQEILMAMGQFDVQAARDVLGRCVREYKPAADLVDLVWSRRERVKAEQAPSNVTPFPPRRPATGK